MWAFFCGGLFLTGERPLWAEVMAGTPIAQGDAQFLDRADPQQSLRALQFYQQAIASQPENTEPLWKASRAAWWAGTLLEKRSERLNLFQKGKEYAQAAVRLNPDSVRSSQAGCSTRNSGGRLESSGSRVS